jgi:LPS-assembly protein
VNSNFLNWNKMITKKLLLLSLVLTLTAPAVLAQTDSKLLKDDITKKITKKVKEKPEYNRTLQDVIKGSETTTEEEVTEDTPEKKIISDAEKAVEQATIEADDLSYDKNSKILTAEKNVILGYSGREVRSEKIEYNQQTNRIIADKGIEYRDGTGTIFKAKSANITDKFDKGEMKDVDVDFGDGSTFHSENLTIIDANTYDLGKASYTPCDMCYNGKPLWQMDADKILYNEADGRVYYDNAYLKFLGQKIGWVPRLSHPTPFAKSKSGFLTPKFGRTSSYGVFVRAPYYYQPQSNLDFTFTPLITSGDGLIMATEMRHLIESGQYEIEVSGANPRELDANGDPIPGGGKIFRGHVKAKGLFHSGENWEHGFDAVRSTDDTYLRRYGFGHYEDVLTSSVYSNWIKNRDYFQVKALAFQGLRQTDDPGQSPVVTPLIDVGKTFSLGDKYNSRIDTSASTLVLNRDEGADTKRAIAEAKWKLDYATSSGHLLNLALGTRTDYYQMNDHTFLGNNYSGTQSRVIPNASLTWSYPLQKLGERYSLILEPISMLAVSPNGINSKKIPNEDSQTVDLADYNLFQDNHILGNDILESGTRVNYGVRGILASESLGDYNFMLGQSYRATKDPVTFSDYSGMSDNLSDYVGRIVTGSEAFQSAYRFRIDKDNGRFKRNEAGLNLNLDPIQMGAGYSFIAGDPGVSTDRQELSSNAVVKLSDSYSITTHATRNLDNDTDEGWVNTGIGLVFNNKCLTTSFEVNKEFTRDRDIQPSTEFIIKISLKNFGS